MVKQVIPSSALPRSAGSRLVTTCSKVKDKLYFIANDLASPQETSHPMGVSFQGTTRTAILVGQDTVSRYVTDRAPLKVNPAHDNSTHRRTYSPS